LDGPVRNDIAESGLAKTTRFTDSAATEALVLMIRAFALVVFMVMAMAEPFPHRWYVLGASVVFLMSYVLYRLVMQGVQRLLR
jgi:CBS domain containing-hemolysin-like protein